MAKLGREERRLVWAEARYGQVNADDSEEMKRGEYRIWTAAAEPKQQCSMAFWRLRSKNQQGRLPALASASFRILRGLELGRARGALVESDNLEIVGSKMKTQHVKSGIILYKAGHKEQFRTVILKCFMVSS